MKVLVGTANQVKVDAVRQAFEGVFPDQKWEIEGRKVDSGVPEQPLHEEETVRGARNRANTLLKQGEADYYVGIEGGLIHSANRWMECGWVIILNNEGVEGIAASAKIMIPDEVYEMLKDGKNTLNDAAQKYFGVKNAGKKTGYVGLMTNQVTNRTTSYVEAIALALSRFAHPEVFEGNDS